TLLKVPLLRWLLPKLNVIPVDQEAIDRSALKALIRVLKAGNGALVFPEGARTLNGNLQPALPGVGLLIAKTLAPVVPMRIFGAHEALPRGGGGLHLHPITIVVGEPIYFSKTDLHPREGLYTRLSERVTMAPSRNRNRHDYASVVTGRFGLSIESTAITMTRVVSVKRAPPSSPVRARMRACRWHRHFCPSGWL